MQYPSRPVQLISGVPIHAAALNGQAAVEPVYRLISPQSELTQDRRSYVYIRILGTMSQVVIHQDERHHRLGNRGGPNTNARIVAALGYHINGLAIHIDGAARRGNA